MPMTQAQIAQQQQAQAHATEMAKRRSRKPTDKTMPEGVEDTVVDPDTVTLYNNLRAYERRLDATLARKRLDMADSCSRYPKVIGALVLGLDWDRRLTWRQHPRTLRIWISNTVLDQSWQQGGGQSSDGFELSTGAEASYRVKIEGRLLDDDHGSPDVAAAEPAKSGEDPDKASADQIQGPHRFSHFFRSLTVDIPNAKPDKMVEWKKPDRPQPSAPLPPTADFDDFTFKRAGDQNMNITIHLHRHEDPERFQLSPDLAAVVDMEEATRQEVLMGIWEYVKAFGLQEDEEKRNFRCDELLKKVRTRMILAFCRHRSWVTRGRSLSRCCWSRYSTAEKSVTCPWFGTSSDSTCNHFHPSASRIRCGLTRHFTRSPNPPSTMCKCRWRTPCAP
jgi:chromatin remodeling complex protein RSC6